MAVNPHLLHHLHIKGAGLAAPQLLGGGFFSNAWGAIKGGARSLGNTVYSIGKRGAEALMPIAVDVGKQAAQNAGQTFLNNAVQGNIRGAFREGAAAGLSSLRRDGLREEVLGALRPVF